MATVTPTTENTLLAIIESLKYKLADQNIRIDLLDHLLAQAAANAALVAVLVILN